MTDWDKLSEARIRYGQFATGDSAGFNGAFRFTIPGEARIVFCIASDGTEWKAVKDWPGYEVSTTGRVKTTSKVVPIPNGALRTQPERLLEPEDTKKGYLRVSLSRNGETVHKLVHVLVAEAFIPNPKEQPQINHRDGNKTNNHLLNLEWCSQEYNHHHAIENGLAPGLTAAQIGDIKMMLESGLTCEEIAEQFERSRQTIGDIKAGRHRDLEPDPPTAYSGPNIFWQHVSVSFAPHSTKIPPWEVMEAIKQIFWGDDAWVVQFHPPANQYVNNHPGCLHLWRPTTKALPTPQSILVGLKHLGTLQPA